MADSSAAIPKVIAYEGVYDFDKDDPGGETVYGITRVHEPDWEGWKFVGVLKGRSGFPDSLKHDLEVQRCVVGYYQSLWDSFSLTMIESQALAECIFNGCINQGAKRVIQWLQYCSNALSETSLDVTEDGKMGGSTIAQIHALGKSVQDGMLLKLLRAQRMAAYTVTIHNRDSSRKYINGWVSRLEQGG